MRERTLEQEVALEQRPVQLFNKLDEQSVWLQEVEKARALRAIAEGRLAVSEVHGSGSNS